MTQNQQLKMRKRIVPGEALQFIKGLFVTRGLQKREEKIDMATPHPVQKKCVELRLNFE